MILFINNSSMIVYINSRIIQPVSKCNIARRRRRRKAVCTTTVCTRSVCFYCLLVSHCFIMYVGQGAGRQPQSIHEIRLGVEQSIKTAAHHEHTRRQTDSGSYNAWQRSGRGQGTHDLLWFVALPPQTTTYCICVYPIHTAHCPPMLQCVLPCVLRVIPHTRLAIFA